MKYTVLLRACAWGIRLLFATISALMIAQWVIQMRNAMGVA